MTYHSLFNDRPRSVPEQPTDPPSTDRPLTEEEKTIWENAWAALETLEGLANMLVDPEFSCALAAVREIMEASKPI